MVASLLPRSERTFPVNLPTNLGEPAKKQRRDFIASLPDFSSISRLGWRSANHPVSLMDDAFFRWTDDVHPTGRGVVHFTPTFPPFRFRQKLEYTDTTATLGVADFVFRMDRPKFLQQIALAPRSRHRSDRLRPTEVRLCRTAKVQGYKTQRWTKYLYLFTCPTDKDEKAEIQAGRLPILAPHFNKRDQLLESPDLSFSILCRGEMVDTLCMNFDPDDGRILLFGRWFCPLSAFFLSSPEICALLTAQA